VPDNLICALELSEFSSNENFADAVRDISKKNIKLGRNLHMNIKPSHSIKTQLPEAE
jgi:hypothetical protein